MDMNAKLIYTTDWEYKVYLTGLTDMAAMKQTIGFLIKDPDENTSNVHTIKKSKLFTSKSAFDFFFDFVGGFDRNDIDTIKANVMDQLKNIHYIDVSEKVTIDEAHMRLCKYVRDHEVEDNVFVDDEGYCNIEYTDKFPSVIKDLELGYKRLELLKMLKILELLKTNEGRVYDYRRYDKDGNDYRVVRFKNITVEETSDAD